MSPILLDPTRPRTAGEGGGKRAAGERVKLDVRNFAAPNELLYVFLNFFYFNPKVALL
jgi:hypothetical protein